MKIRTNTSLNAKAIAKIIGQEDDEALDNLAWGIHVEKAGAIELLVDQGWKAKKIHRSEFGPNRPPFFSTEGVSVSVLRYWDKGVYYTPVEYGTPAQVKASWEKIQQLAKEYKFAEQPDPGKEKEPPSQSFSGKFKNWPNSIYENALWFSSNARNSNSFITFICQKMRYSINYLPGWNPGVEIPRVKKPPRMGFTGDWFGNPFRPD